MHCYQHQESVAIGICKACQKAVCPMCSKDTGNGLACSLACEKEVSEVNQIMEKSKQIYSIGRKSSLPSTGILIYLFFGLVFLGVGLFPLAKGKDPEWFALVMGLGFLLFFVLAYVRTRKLNINC
jgi:hypothetical protein